MELLWDYPFCTKIIEQIHRDYCFGIDQMCSRRADQFPEINKIRRQLDMINTGTNKKDAIWPELLDL